MSAHVAKVSPEKSLKWPVKYTVRGTWELRPVGSTGSWSHPMLTLGLCPLKRMAAQMPISRVHCCLVVG